MNVSVYQSHNSQLHDDNENVFVASLIDRYAARPLALQNIGLATFGVTYDVIQSSTKTGETEDVNAEEEMQNTENDNSVTKIEIAKRIGCYQEEGNREEILCPGRYKIHAEPEKYYYSKLLLYYPWNHEDDIIPTYTTYHDSYMSKQDITYIRMHKNSMKAVWHLIWTFKIWKTIYHSLHGRWLLKILPQDDRTNKCPRFLPHCRMSNKKKKIP